MTDAGAVYFLFDAEAANAQVRHFPCVAHLLVMLPEVAPVSFMPWLKFLMLVLVLLEMC